MYCTRALVFLFPAIWLAVPASAQPDRTAALEKAKTKFEAEVAKSEEALLASIDKALKAAQGNKALVEKLTYEREVFVKHRLTPTAVPTAAYLKQRSAAVTTLEGAYKPVIKELVKAKKAEEADALETALSNLIKSARGYGPAIPDLEGRPMFLIENKATGLVIETTNKEGSGEVVLGTKVGKKKPGQCWYLERDAKGFVVRNVPSGQAFHVPAGSGSAGTVLVMWPSDPTKEVGAWSLFQVAEVQHEIVITAFTNGLILTATERKQKGVTTHVVTQEKKETPPLSSQRWTLVEVK